MPRALIVHVGLPRAGAKHLQGVLTAARPELAAAGVLAPAPPGVRHPVVPLEARLDAYLEPYLDLLRPQLVRHRGLAVISLEQLALADVGQARRVLGRLGVEPERTTVVVTARDLGRSLPARWQAEVELGSTQFYEPCLAGLVEARRAATTPAALDLPGVVGRWRRVVGPERVVVVTAPRHGMEPDLLWRRFATATGLPADVPEGLTTALASGPPGHADDVPMSASQVKLSRTVNAALRADGYPVRLQQAMRSRLVAVWRNLDAVPTASLTVPVSLRAAVRTWAAEDVAHLLAREVRVVGPLTDLEPLFGPAPDTSDVPAADDAVAQHVDDALGRDVLALLTADRFGAPPDGPSRHLRRAMRGWAGRRRGTTSVPGRRTVPSERSLPAPRVSDSPATGLALGAVLDGALDVRDPAAAARGAADR